MNVKTLTEKDDEDQSKLHQVFGPNGFNLTSSLETMLTLAVDSREDTKELVFFENNSSFTMNLSNYLQMSTTLSPNEALLHLCENCTSFLNYSKSLSELTNFTTEKSDSNYPLSVGTNVFNSTLTSTMSTSSLTLSASASSSSSIDSISAIDTSDLTTSGTNSTSTFYPTLTIVDLTNISEYVFNNVSTASHNISSLLLDPDIKIHYPLLACFLAVICLLVIFGNVLIMIAIKRERYLHTVTNYFIASLAAADCLVGVVVMPFSVVHEVMNKWWIFGQDWCDLWHSFDVLASTASILNLCVISLDRYWAITDPMTYPAKMTPNKAVILIGVVWTLSALISFPAIIWWRATMMGPPPKYQCQWTEDIGYLVFSSLISFYLPLTVMLFVYYRIYKAAVAQTKSVKRGTKLIQTSASDGNAVTLRIHRGGGAGEIKYHPTVRTKYSGETGSGDEHSDFSVYDVNEMDLKGISVRHRNLKSWSMGRKFAKFSKEKKAAKTLGIVMGVFILCWLPFFITNIIMGFCAKTCLSDSTMVHSVVTWLGWLNSGMNPAIYACWSRDFRRAFKKILCCCCQKRATNRMNRKFKQGRYSFTGETMRPKRSNARNAFSSFTTREKAPPPTLSKESIAMITRSECHNGRQRDSLNGRREIDFP